MNRARDQLLARAGLTVDQHGAVHRRHQFERGEQRLHRAVPPDDVLEPELAFELCLQLRVLFPQSLLLEPGLQHAGELRQLERLNQEVHGAPLDRRDRFGDTAEPGHHHRANLRVPLESLVEYCHAVGVGQPQVDNESVVRERPEPLDGIGGVAGLGGDKAGGFEAGDDGLTEIEVVFDDQNGRQSALGHMFVRVNKSSPDPASRDWRPGGKG
jgi:hypothetical protein